MAETYIVGETKVRPVLACRASPAALVLIMLRYLLMR